MVTEMDVVGIMHSFAIETSVEIWFNQQSQYDLLLAEQQRDSLHAMQVGFLQHEGK